MLELLEGRLGLVDLLDEATRFGDATPRDLGAKLFSAPSLSGTARFGRTPRNPDAFTLHHYAGPVSYQLANMLERNRHAVVPEHTQLLASAACCCPLLAAMVAVPPAAAAPPMPGQRQVGGLLLCVPRHTGPRLCMYHSTSSYLPTYLPTYPHTHAPNCLPVYVENTCTRTS